MVIALLAALGILYFLGYIVVPWFSIPNILLFTIFGVNIYLFDLLIFIVLAWIVGILPSPLREIAFAVFVIWILAVLGIIAMPGLPGVLIVAFIAGLVVFLFTGP